MHMRLTGTVSWYSAPRHKHKDPATDLHKDSATDLLHDPDQVQLPLWVLVPFSNQRRGLEKIGDEC